MKRNFGDKAIREKMLSDPLLRGRWEDATPVHALDPVDHLIAKVGIGIVQTVESYYQKFCKQPNESNAKAYCLWRLRLHRRLNNDRDLLEAINDARNLGLDDNRPGNTCWDLVFN